MLLEIRKITFHSIQEFLREYLMIVVGILTALGLEHVIANHHHHQAAEQSRQQIVAELRANLMQIRQARDRNLKRTKPLADLAAALRKDLLAGRSKASILQTLQAHQEGRSNIGCSIPTVRHEAWEVMVANQTAIYMDAAVLRRYSSAYAVQRDVMTVLIQSIAPLINDPQFLTVAANQQLESTDPKTLWSFLVRISGTLRLMEDNLSSMQTQLEKALEDDPEAPQTAISSGR